ncbi:MAG TPA: BtpA/SgcQ family protein [Anaerolineae bacterium]|nr:BtpA/SgcQ family protein [Anaerolineae bacterium]
MRTLFDLKPMVIGALLLPELGRPGNFRAMAWLEDFVSQNLKIFADAGFPAMMIQDLTPNPSLARPETIAIMSALCRFARQEFPQLMLGTIIQAHDPSGALAIAHASGASFVRIKVFVGAMVKADGIEQGCGIEARDFRRTLGREDIKILADVHDRTGFPLGGVPIETASQWAVYTGADALILTGMSYQGSLQYVQTVRNAGIQRPLVLGGSATAENIAEVFRYYDGVIVSTALRATGAAPDEIIQWDQEKVQRFMDAARRAAGQ